MVLSIYTMDDLTSNLYLTHESSGDKCIAAQLFSGGKKKANDSSKKIPCPAGEKTAEEKKMDDDDPTKKSSIPDFLSKLYQMLNFEDAEIIQWDQGKIYVKDPDKLGKEVLKKYFRHSRYTSFQRQLNYFGFKKIEGKGKFSPCVYANDDFKGPDMRAILNIKRKTHAQHDYDLLMLAALDPKLWNETNGLSLEGSRKFLKKRNMSMGCMEPSSLRENKALRRTKSERCWEEQERQPTRGVGSRHCSNNNNNNNHNSGEKPTKKINKKLTRRSSKTRRRPQNGKHRSSSSSNQQKSEESSKSSLSHEDDDSKSSLSFVQLTENLLGPDQGEDDGVVLRYSDIMAAAEVLLHEDDYDDNKDDVLVGVGKARNKNLSGLDLAHHHHQTLNQPECSSDHLHNQQGIMSSDNVPSIHMFEEQVCLSSPTAPSNTTVLNENERTHGEVSTCNHTQEHSRLSLDMDTIEQLASLMEGLPDWAAASTEEESCTSSSAAEIMTPIPQSSSNSSFVVLEEDDNVDDDINWDGVVLQSILR